MLRSKRGWLALLAGAAIVLAVLFQQPQRQASTPSAPHAVNGLLDLSNWSLERHGSVRLNGEWSMYWNELLQDKETAARVHPVNAVVPGLWSRYGAPGQGYATYRLTIRNAEETGKLALNIPAIAPAYRMLVNGHVIAESGSVSKERADVQSKYYPQTVFFDPPGKEFDLFLQVSNELYPRGGIWYSMTLGSERAMIALKERTENLDMAVFGGCALLGLYQIALFAMRRSERSSLYFGICCLLGAVRIWAVGGIYLVHVFPDIDIRIVILLEYLTYYGGVTFALLFVRELYPQEYDPKAIKTLAGIGFAFIGSVVLLPAEWYTRFIEVFKYVSLLSLAYILFGFSLALWRKRKGALLQLTGWLIFTAAALHDILYSIDILIWVDVQLVPFGFILLLFFEALVLAKRFTNAFRTIETISDELIAMNRMKDEFLANTSHE
ncbi:MAG: response regulator, partial [Paenibacillus sp.]|nr:response regulator [Paenibacillus sp.]